MLGKGRHDVYGQVVGFAHIAGNELDDFPSVALRRFYQGRDEVNIRKIRLQALMLRR